MREEEEHVDRLSDVLEAALGRLPSRQKTRFSEVGVATKLAGQKGVRQLVKGPIGLRCTAVVLHRVMAIDLSR